MEARIDILLTDVIMPRMNGVAAAEHIDKLRPGIKVVFTTGYIDRAFDYAALHRPGTILLPKPFSEHELLTALRTALDSPDKSTDTRN